MSKKKSFVSAFSDVTLSADKVDQVEATHEDESFKTGPLKFASRQLEDIRSENERLKKLAATGAGVIEIDPDLIDPSPFVDRLKDDDNSAIDGLKESLARQGQKVPVLLRRHPHSQDRYQIVFGHRRCQALRELNTAVKALVVDYDDTELVVAQGIENSRRQDLSWIERAVFADHMRQAGLNAKDIKAALSIDDAEHSKLRSVTKVLPKKTIELIGRAPKIGRNRWLDLMKRIAGKDDIKHLDNVLSQSTLKASDDRFLLALATLSADKVVKPEPEIVQLGKVGKIMFQEGKVNLVLDKKHAQEIQDFLRQELPKLLKDYV